MMKNQQEIATPRQAERAPQEIANEMQAERAAQNGTIEENNRDMHPPARENRKKRGREAQGRIAAKRLTYLATLTAISLVLKVISNSISQFVPPTFKVSFSYLGWYLSAAVMGPIGGAAVAAVTDVLGQFVIPSGGAPNPVLTLGNAAATMAFGLVFAKAPLKNAAARAAIAATVSLVIGTLGINSLGLYYMYYAGTNYIVYLAGSRLAQVPIAYLNVVLFVLALPACRRIGLVDKDSRPLAV